MKRILVTSVAILAATLSPAYSANVTVIAEGVFEEYTDPDGLLPFSEPAPGTVFRMVFTYDSDAPDWLLHDPSIGIYGSAISSVTLMIGSDTFGMGASSRTVNIFNDVVATAGGFIDIYVAQTDTQTPTGTPNQTLIEGFGLGLVSSAEPSIPVPPLTSDALVPPPLVSAWEEGYISYSIRLNTEQPGPNEMETLARAAANITSIEVVPVPAAIWLFGSALGFLGWMRPKTA